MNWVLFSLISALLLGFYDAAKKWSVRDNAVPIVLLCSVSVGAAIYLPVILISMIWGDQLPWPSFVVRPLSSREHLWVFGKSVLVGVSWTCAFTALKHLPLSIAAPIRATSPFWTILIATSFLGERPSPIQWLGIVVVLLGFWRFSGVGRLEGIQFHRDRWVLLMTIATLLGALSSIYDKWLLQSAGFDPVSLQAWFTVYLVPVMMPLAGWWLLSGRGSGSVGRKVREEGNSPSGGSVFQWRRSILLVSPLLLLADWFYFVALSDPEAMVSIVSVLRRCSVVISLVIGAKALSESNFRAKFQCVLLILAGVLLLTWHG